MEGCKTFLCSSKFQYAREKMFFEIYRQFGHAPSKSFASPAIDTQCTYLSGCCVSIVSQNILHISSEYKVL